MPPAEFSALETKKHSVRYVHTVSEGGRLLPSASRWNSIALDNNLAPNSSTAYHSIPSNYSKSVDYNLVITDKKHFYRFLFIAASIVFLVVAAVLLVHFRSQAHKHRHQRPPVNLKLAINQALTFYDAQKSGHYPRNSPVKFRGDSGLEDGLNTPENLTGGFYDSGNNIKFTFTTAYTVTLLSWTVIEYQGKYAYIGELDHVRDIIRWGSDYLLKAFVLPNVGSAVRNNNGEHNDITCWQRPEDMTYARPVSQCNSSASDLAREFIAALSAASLVFREDKDYSGKLVKAAQSLYDVVTTEDPSLQGKYTTDDDCGKEARMFYNSSGYEDELAWGGTWLYIATKNTSYLQFATDTFKLAKNNETGLDKSVFYWNNKLGATGVLLSRILYFQDPGSSQDALILSSNLTESLMCTFLFNKYSSKTPGGLIIIKPVDDPLLQYAATSSFLSKLFGDYLDHQKLSGASCGTDVYSLQMLHDFAASQVNYIMGQNPIKMSYMVGYGDKFPLQVHHRSASIPWDGQPYTCDEGKKWLNSKDPNPQVPLGAMVGGPGLHDNFMDDRNQPRFTEPTIASNAGLLAALIALQDPPLSNSKAVEDSILGWN
ncbi:LOW QUALITY PROTEIN: endoglucanase 9-like [Prosopis cineraria]|uniref:LOW QUALITY PROTEIN: endoglucanase 9-like n=1 Tax=Prosopis cineraria TaxID=364024 RepID=UPI00240F18CD|nr:LOW QUALITY PROTEIN: endoglucanase 9-like [Prosopis cineraria]